MPNHVHNILIFDCSLERFEEVKKLVKSKTQAFDFNKIIPMPKSLNITSGSTTDNAVELFLTASNPDGLNYGYPKLDKKTFDKIYKKICQENVFWRPNITMSIEDFCQKEENTNKYCSEENKFSSWEDLAKTAIANLVNHGATTWYEWCVKNWDTKWNAYSINESVNGYDFDTAWSAPHNVIVKLSKQVPDVTIIHKWADEDLGSNCGEAVIKNGLVTDLYEPESYEAGREFACSVWGIDDDEYDEE